MSPEPASSSPPPSPADPSDPPSYALDDLSWQEAAAILARDPRLILPVGALEQHGLHLPLGTNTYIAERLAADLARSTGVLRAPTFPYGVATPGSRAFPGSATLRRKTLHRAINELLASWEDHGVDEFIVLTAQRYEPHLDALLMALTETSTTTVIDLYAIDISDLVEGSPLEEHAGEVETSLLLHLAPGRVRRDRVEDEPLDSARYRRYVRGRMPTPPTGLSGTFGRPSRASAERGQAIYRRYLERIRAAVLPTSEWRADHVE